MSGPSGRSAQASPKDFNTRYLLGATLVKIEKRDEAIREWRQALQLQPEHYWARYYLALCRLNERLRR